MISRDHPSTSTTPPPPFRASDYINDSKPHLLLAASGSVATIKIPQILTSLSHHSLSVRLILTSSASRFLSSQSDEQPSLDTLAQIPNVDGIYEDADEWEFSSDHADEAGMKTRGWIRGDPILHIELRKWADMMAIIPLSANMLAKITGGMSDGLLASVVRAWDTTGLVDGIRMPMVDGRRREGCVLGQKPRIMVAPAMNTAMWRQPITARQIRVLEEEWGVEDGQNTIRSAASTDNDRGTVEEGWFEVLRPIEKSLACGDIGGGGMREWKEIVGLIEVRLGLGNQSDIVTT